MLNLRRKRLSRFTAFCHSVSRRSKNRTQLTYKLSQLTNEDINTLIKLESKRSKRKKSCPVVPTETINAEPKGESDPIISMDYHPTIPSVPTSPLIPSNIEEAQEESATNLQAHGTNELVAGPTLHLYYPPLSSEAIGDATIYSLTCSHCPKTFKTRGGKSKHMQTHRDRVICAICKRSYATDTGLNNHMLMHSSENACPECHKTYCSTNGLKRHITRSHGKT